jgi:hypothetical protein
LEEEMRHIVLAGILATLALGAALSAAQADSYYGPHRVGNRCWVNQGGGPSLGYWEPCREERTATRGRAGASKGRSASGAGAQGGAGQQGGGNGE